MCRVYELIVWAPRSIESARYPAPGANERRDSAKTAGTQAAGVPTAVQIAAAVSAGRVET